jgi:lantibiotic biosynthesis protein
MGWQPVLTGALRDAALDSALALIRSLDPPRATDQRSACLGAGAAGLAVCHAVVAQECQDGQARELATGCLDSAIEVLASQPFSMSLYSGFTGIAWAADLVDRLLPGEIADRNDEIDLALAQAVRHYPKDGPYDLIDGLTGLGIYALARWPRSSAAECLVAILAELDGRARRDGDGVYWWTPAAALIAPRRQLYPAGGVDMGVAHGIAGVLPLLARACSLGVAEATVRPLLDGAVRWLMAHLVDSPAGPTTPSFLADGTEPGPARSAWCYGDPGVALALLLAARDLGEPSWQRTGTELALRAARRPPEDTRVSDAGVCHGTAGLAHLFTRMYQLTGERELADAAVTWAERTLALCAARGGGEDGLDGSGPAARPWSGPGLLEGAAGIALVLLAGCVPAEPVWDQMLLVSTGAAAAVSAP